MPKKTVNSKQSTVNSQEAAELMASLQRLQADFINYKARAEKERSEALKMGREMAVSELLPVFDNLERAFAHTPADLKDNTWVKGINALEKQLLDVLSILGLSKIETADKPFNPNTMEAVGVDEASPSKGTSHEVVVEELQAGYMFGDRVLRPAMVRVRK